MDKQIVVGAFLIGFCCGAVTVLGVWAVTLCNRIIKICDHIIATIQGT